MFESYFKIGWRNLLRNKSYSVINIGGLAVGMAVALLIGLWVYDELSFNRYHHNYQRIASVVRNATLNDDTFTSTYLPYDLGEELKNVYGDNFEHVVMAIPPWDYIVSAGNVSLMQKGFFVDAGAPEMFTLEMLEGTREGLKDSHSILLSATAARNIFGDEEAMDKMLRISNTMDVKVTGIYKDLPHNSQFHDVQFFSPLNLLAAHNEWMKQGGFVNNFLNIYVQVNANTNFKTASNNVKDAIKNNVKDNKEFLAINPQLFLHPMEKWHLQSEWKNGELTNGLLQFVWLFALIGGFVLLLACINFMNLSTARSEKRAKEVGIRKSMGSIRGHLVTQFFSESFLVVVLSFICAIAIASLSLPFFNDIAGKDVSMPLASPYFWLVSVGFIFLTGLIAGSYPALYLSSFNPVKALKGTYRLGRLSSMPRKVLVIVQFTISVTLVIGTVIVYKQIQFAKNRPVGFDRDGLIMLEMTSPEFYGKYDLLREELKGTGVVEEMAQSTGPVTAVYSSDGGFDWEGKDANLQTNFGTLTVTPEYGSTVGWQFLQGRDFSRNLASDSSGFVINEAALKFMGFKEPIGETITWKNQHYQIIGVIKDMVMGSPYAASMPTIFFIKGGFVNYINIKIKPNVSATTAMAQIEKVFKKLIPSAPFDYTFADQEYAYKFAAEERIGTLTSIFSVLAVLISCLGLFGLASFVAEQRTKEIGIRKVVGASVLNLWKLLSKDFIVLVITSSLISIPIAYYFLSGWLQKYEYHTDISWWIFAVTIIGAVFVTLVTVSFQAVKAATANPVKSLKFE